MFNNNAIPLQLISSVQTHEHKFKATQLQKDKNIGENDIKLPETFELSKRHTDVSAQHLSDHWHISLHQVIQTLERTTQKIKRSAPLPLS